MDKLLVGSVVRDLNGSLWVKDVDDIWYLLKASGSGVDPISVEELGAEIVWEPDKLEGLRAGSIIQSRDNYTHVAVLNRRGVWEMNDRTYTPEGIKAEMGKGGFDVVKGDR